MARARSARDGREHPGVQKLKWVEVANTSLKQANSSKTALSGNGCDVARAPWMTRTITMASGNGK